MKLTRIIKELKKTDIYNACEGKYVVNKELYYALRNELKNQDEYTDKDLFKQKLKEIKTKSRKQMILSPIQILKIISEDNEFSEEFSEEFERFRDNESLPCSSLLEKIHFYSSMKMEINKNDKMTKKFDGSSLVVLGLLIDQWIDDIFDERSVYGFVEKETNLEVDLEVDLDLDLDLDLNLEENEVTEQEN